MKTKYCNTSTFLYQVSITLFFLLSSCVHKNQENHPSNNVLDNVKFRIVDYIPDSLEVNKVYKNSVVFESSVDSLKKAENLHDSIISHNTFLFVYQFNSKESIPNKIEDYNENESDIFIPRDKKEIEFSYKFDSIGHQYLHIIYLENIYFTTANGDSLRVIDNYHTYKQKLYIKD